MGTQSPSVFQAAVPVSQRAVLRKLFTDIISSCVLVAVCCYSCERDEAIRQLKGVSQEVQWRRHEDWYVYSRRQEEDNIDLCDNELCVVYDKTRDVVSLEADAGGGRCM